MSTEHKSSRDELDLIITKQLRLDPPPRAQQTIPAPARDEPSDDELLFLLEGQLSADDASALEARLATHPFSHARLEILREALAETRDAALAEAPSEAETTPPSAIARLVFVLHRSADHVLSFVRGTDVPLPLMPTLLPTRSAPHAPDEAPRGETLYRFERRFGICDASIHVERLPGQGVDIRVELSQEKAPLTDARASLRRDGKLLESLRIRDGRVDFVNIEPTTAYDVELRRQGELFGTIRLDFLNG